MTTPELLFLSNGHGEDEIAGLILDELLREGADPARIVAWPMVGSGARYARAGIAIIGPTNSLPSEGFGTVSLAAFLRDLKAGFLGTYLAQARFARRLRARAVVAIGDIVPLTAARLSGAPTLFFSSAKSAHYGGTDGHNPLERWLMRGCRSVLVRDERTARRLRGYRVPARFVGNPMMDGVAGADPGSLARPESLVLALIPGTRADAIENTRLLIDAAGRAGKVHGLVPAHDRLDLMALAAALPPGWRTASATDGAALSLVHDGGATAEVIKGRFADCLASADLAVGMAGTANEQAVGLGLPLVAVPGGGNQGTAYVRMKGRYFGKAAITAPPEAAQIADVLSVLADDFPRRAAMAEAGRALMGAPGASAAIADEIRTLVGWEHAHG